MKYIKVVPLFLYAIYIGLKNLYDIKPWLEWTIIGIMLLVSIIVLYKTRKEITRKTIIFLAITLVVILSIGAYYYFIVPNQ
jgi:hypothetical protein